MKELSLHLLDIIQNSVRAGAAQVDVSLEETGGVLTMTVTDDGCGMSPALLERVSDPFTTTRTTRKMGLGIPLLRMAAEQTGGSVAIESQEGVGTRIGAVFHTGHIDCPPLGDIASTVALTIQGSPGLEVRYIHRRDGREISLDTRDLRAQLGEGISLAEPEITLWIQDFIREQEETLS